MNDPLNEKIFRNPCKDLKFLISALYALKLS